MAKKTRVKKSAPAVSCSNTPSSTGVLGSAEIKKIHGLLKSKTPEGVALGLSLLESLGATSADYEHVLTEAVIVAVLNGWNAEAWGALARATRPRDAVFNRVCGAIMKKREDLAGMIRRRDVDQAVALIRSAEVPALYEALLADCAVIPEGPRAGEITRNRLFDENEEHRTRALLRIAAYAPRSAAVSASNVQSLVIDVTHRQEHTGWHQYEDKLVEQSVLTELPGEIGLFVNLTGLHLRNTAIEMLPDSLGSLSQLRQLEIVGGKKPGRLRALPDSVGRLASLRVLRIEENELRELPEAIGLLAALEIMTLVRCRLTELPQSFGDLGNLRTLRLSECGLKSLPDSLGNLCSLKTLDLGKCPITRLPNSVGELATLKEFNLSDTRLETLPATIGQLGRLRALNVSGCPIDRLPDSIGDLFSLEELDLSRTAITALPATIGRLGNLRKLVLPSGLVDIPFEIGFLSLTELHGGAGPTRHLLDVCRRAFEAVHKTSVICLPDPVHFDEGEAVPKKAKPVGAAIKEKGRGPSTEDIKRRIDLLVGEVLSRCATGRGPDVLGPALWPLVERGSPRAVVACAFYSDILRLMRDLMVVCGDAGAVESRESLCVLSMLVASIFRTNDTYTSHADASIAGVPRFLDCYECEGASFGYANTATKWAGVRVCRNIATLFGDEKPFADFTDALVGWAGEFAGHGGNDSDHDGVVQACRKAWASL